MDGLVDFIDTSAKTLQMKVTATLTILRKDFIGRV